MFYVVAYDIRDNRRRTRVARILEDFGDRAQYSVFEMELDRPERIEALQRRLKNAIEPSEDGVRTYFLCRDCRKKAAVLGQGHIYSDDDVYIV